MGAYINALREEGTRSDLLRELERVLSERDEYFDALLKILEPFNNFDCDNDTVCDVVASVMPKSVTDAYKRKHGIEVD
jgi:hypothetical protein